MGGAAIGAFLHSYPHAFTTLKVGSKLDNEALLLGEMYVLLLQNASYQVIDMTLTGQSIGTFNSLMNKDIDVYPEYSQSALAQLNQHSTGNQPQDLQIVSDQYQQRYQIFWLTSATLLNDNYCVAIPQQKAREIGSSISDLALYNQGHSLSVAVAPDGMNDVIPLLIEKYKLTFASPYTTPEQKSFEDVVNNKADLNICYSTDPLLKIDHFIRLKDDKGAFPADSPSPIIRADVLKLAPDIDSVLKPLAGVLTTDDSVELQGNLPPSTSSKELRRAAAQNTARVWLTKKGLL